VSTEPTPTPSPLWTFEASLYLTPDRTTTWITSSQRFRSVREATMAANGFVMACRGYGISAATSILAAEASPQRGEVQ